MDMVNKLPNGWSSKTFDELFDYIQPTKYIVESTDYDDKFKTPVLTAGKSFIIGYTNETSGIFNKTPVIIFDDFTTATKFVNFPFKVKSSAMKILSPKDQHTNIKFAFYYMQTLNISTDTHKRYWISEYSKIKIPFPIPSEQDSIVSKIEELLSDLENGKQQLLTAQQQLKIYRQSLLKWAFEGKLTNDDVKDGELPEGWRILELKEVCEIKRGKSKHRPRNEKSLFGGEYPFIQTGDIRNANGGYISKYSQTYNEKGLEQSKLWPKGTLCITIAANIGETAILGIDACFPDSVVGLICNEQLLLNKFTNYYFISHKSTLEGLAPATAQKNINVDILEKIKIPIPKLEEQQRIVDELESRLTVCDKIEETITQSLQQAETLKQSILKMAFEGRLVTNHEGV
jgi:type I restriction enzyme S subunit